MADHYWPRHNYWSEIGPRNIPYNSCAILALLVAEPLSISHALFCIDFAEIYEIDNKENFGYRKARNRLAKPVLPQIRSALTWCNSWLRLTIHRTWITNNLLETAKRNKMHGQLYWAAMFGCLKKREDWVRPSASNSSSIGTWHQWTNSWSCCIQAVIAPGSICSSLS